MPTTPQDIDEFSRFAKQHIDDRGPASLVDLARLWEAERREFEETVTDVRAGISDYEAGLGMPVKDSFAQIRRELGLAE